MSNPIWPVSLPQSVLLGNSESINAYVARTAMDVGPPKVRRRATKSLRTYSVKLNLSATQVATLDSFWLTSLSAGTAVFDWYDPRQHVTTTFRFVGPPAYKNLSPDYSLGDGSGRWEADIQLEVP